MKIKIFFLAMLEILLLSCSLTNNPFDAPTTPITVEHTLVFSGKKIPGILWEHEFHTTGNYFGDVHCTALDGALIATGRFDSAEKIKTYALDGASGEVIWSLDDVGILESSTVGLFIGTNSSDLYLIQPNDGQMDWKVNLEDSDNIRAMYFADELLYINTNGYYQYYVVDKNGVVIAKYREVSTFINEYSGVAFNPSLPFFDIAPGDVYVLQFGDILYSMAAYSSSSNEVLWESSTYSISNFLIHKEFIFWLSPDDMLLGADKRTGEITIKYEITPSINFFDKNPEKQHAGYYLCGDEQLNLVYLFLGDSHQLFSINLAN